MLARLLYLVALVTWSNNHFGQYFGFLHTNPGTYYYNLLPAGGNSLISVAAFRQGAIPTNNQVFILTFKDTQVVDNHTLPRSLYPSSLNPIKNHDSILWAATICDTSSNSGNALTVAAFDSALHFAGHYRLTAFDQVQKIPMNIVKIGQRYFTGFVDPALSKTSLFKLDAQFVKLDSAFLNFTVDNFDTDGTTLLMKGLWVNSTCDSTSKVQALKMDTSFAVTDCFSFDSLGIHSWGSVNNILHVEALRYSKVVKLNNNKTLTLSNHIYSDGPFEPLTEGILYSIYDHSKKSLVTIPYYKKNTVYAFNDWTRNYDIKNDTIVTVACVGYDWTQFPLLQPQKTKMLVTLLDTTGSILWTKEFGGDYYYFPRTIRFAGNRIIIAGLRSDPASGSSTMESFLFGISRSGDTLTTGVNARVQPAMGIFPNPATNNFSINATGSGPISVRIFDIAGRQMAKTDTHSGHLIDIRHLSPGIYIVLVQSKRGTIARRLVKE